MKVFFLENVVHVAKKGEIKDVKPGYAINMLFPKKLAVELTPKVEKEISSKAKKDEAHRREIVENRHSVVDKLNHKKLSFNLKTDNSGKVYGSIGERDIIIKIKKLFNLELTKKHIDLPSGHIKKIGNSEVFIKLGNDSMAKMFINVSKKNG